MSTQHILRRNHALKPIPRLLLALLAPFSVLPAFAQQAPATAPAAPSTAVQSDGKSQYIGDATRVSVGLASGGNLQGEISSVLLEDNTSAWLGELWAMTSSGGR